MYYKNVSYSEKTFYGVTFQPGETKEVDQYINNKFMVLVDKVENTEKEEKESPQQINKQQKPSSEKSKKGEDKKIESDASVNDAKVSSESDKSNS